MLIVFYITTTPYLPTYRVIKRKELYDFYYTIVTLTTGYKMKMRGYSTKIPTTSLEDKGGKGKHFKVVVTSDLGRL